MAFLVDPDEFLATPEAQPPATPQTTAFKVSPEDFLKTGQEQQPTAVQSPAFHISPEDFLAQPTTAAPPAQSPPNTTSAPDAFNWSRIGRGVAIPPARDYVTNALTYPDNPEHQRALDEIQKNPDIPKILGIDQGLVDAARAKAAGQPPPGLTAAPLSAGSPQINAEELPVAPKLPKDVPAGTVMVKSHSGEYAPPAPQSDFQQVKDFLLSPPDDVQDAVRELNRMMVGPFQVLQKAIVEPAASMTTPAALATAGAGGLIGAAAASGEAATAAAGKAANVALSTWFAGQSAKQILKDVPEAKERFDQGDYWGALADMGSAGTSAFLGTLSALHAHGELSQLETLAATKRALQERLNVEHAASEMQQPGRTALPPAGEQPPPSAAPPALSLPPAPPVAAEAAPAVQSTESLPEQTPGAQAPILKGSVFETSQGKITVSGVNNKGVLYSLETPEGKSLQRVSTEDFQQLIHPAPPPPAGQPAQGSGQQQPGSESLAPKTEIAGIEPQHVVGERAEQTQQAQDVAAPNMARSPEDQPVEQTQIATGKEPDVALQDFVSGRGGFGSPARMVIRSGRDVTPDEIRGAFFPDLGPDQLQIQKLRTDDFMSAVQPGRQPFTLQFMKDGRAASAPEGIESRLGLQPGESYHAPARTTPRDSSAIAMEQGSELPQAEPPQASSTPEAVDQQEPPVAAGHVRLYRGEPKDLTNRAFAGTDLDPGRYFSSSRSTAETYGPRLKYVDVTAEEHERLLREEDEARQYGGGSYLQSAVYLPPELANSAKPLRGGELQAGHDFASTQANLPASLADKVIEAGKQIPDDQLASDAGSAVGGASAAKGREDQPHVTVLYGLHDEDPNAAREILANEPPINATLGKASIFETPDADVLKVGVESPDLHRLNGKLAKLDHTSTYPTYQPHVTIAYLKPGLGAQYDGKPIPGVSGETVQLHSVAFSDKSGKQVEIPLKGEAAAANGEAAAAVQSTKPQQELRPGAQAQEEKSPSSTHVTIPESTHGEQPDSVNQQPVEAHGAEASPDYKTRQGDRGLRGRPSDLGLPNRGRRGPPKSVGPPLSANEVTPATAVQSTETRLEPEKGAKAQPFLSFRKLADKATNSLFPRAIYKHGVIWVNARTMQHIAGIPAHGVRLSREASEDALADLKKNPSALGLFPGPALKALKQGLEEGANGSGAILVHHTPRRTLSDLKAVVRHENFHRNEPLTGAYSKGVELLKNPLAKIAAEHLSKRAADQGHPEYYRLDDPAEMWSEIGAHLAGGPLHWKALGLDYDQAKELWRVYLKLWHPDDLAHIKKITPLLNETLHAARAQAEIRRRGGDAYSPIEGSPGKWDLRSGVREAVSAPRRFSLSGEGPAGEAAAAQAVSPAQHDWPSLAQEAEAAPDESLLRAYPARYAPMLSEIQGREGMATNLRQLADSLHSEGDAETLRALLSSAFTDAAQHSGKWAPPAATPAVQSPGGPQGPTAGAQAQTGSSGNGPPNLSNAKQWLNQKFGNDGPRANYSGLGALRSRFMPGANLSQLEAANTTAHTAALRAASSRAQAATILRAAVPPITRALHGSGISWAEMRTALIESRLQGLRDRWQAFADQMGTMPDQALHDGFDDILGLVKSVEGKQGLPQDLAQTASSMIESGSTRIDPKSTAMTAKEASNYYAGLRKFLQQTFEDAADAVTTAMPTDRFEEVTGNRQFQSALQTYKKLVEGPMARNHALNEGIFSTALGPLDTYYPLIPLEKGVQSGGPGRRLPYHKPKNMANAFATGLSEAYDPDMEAFKERLSRAIRGNDKAAYLRTLEEQGLLQPVVPGEDHFIDRQGNAWEGERVEIAPGRTVFANGQAIHTPARMGIMPRWLNRESRPLLEGQPLDPEVGNKIIRFINTLALSGPADFVFHSANVLGSLIANTPFLGTALSDKALSLPLVKKFGAIFKVLATDPTTEESAADLIAMAKLGIVPSKYASTTLSRVAADQLGAEYKAWKLATIGGKDIVFPKGFSPMLYGPKGLDIRARLFVYRLAREINPDANPQQLHHFVNVLGNYVPELQSSIERGLKSTGWSPFFTAGSTMIRNGINAWTGAGPTPNNAASMRAWQQITGGALATVALWYVAYKLLTGKDPTKDKRVKFLQIPVGNGNGPIDRFRHSAVGDKLWGKGPEVGYLNFGFFNPLVSRGARALGLPGALETRTLGGTIGQQIEAGQRDILNSFAHPVLGPLTRSTFVGITGDEPYLTDLRDRGQMAPRLMPAVPSRLKPGFLGGFSPAIASGLPKKNPGFLATEGAKSAAALRELNAFYGNLGENTGMLGPDKGEKGDRYLRMIVDLTMPGLVSNASNPYARMKYIQQSKKAMQ